MRWETRWIRLKKDRTVKLRGNIVKESSQFMLVIRDYKFMGNSGTDRKERIKFSEKDRNGFRKLMKSIIFSFSNADRRLYNQAT